MLAEPHRTCKADCCHTVDILRGQKLLSLPSRDFESASHSRHTLLLAQKSQLINMPVAGRMILTLSQRGDEKERIT